MEQRVLFVGGGSLGHITPSIAVLQALRASGQPIKEKFVCSNRADEMSFLETEGIAYTTIPSAKLNFTFPITFTRACLQSAAIIRTFKPDCIFSKGGYISVPMCLVAWTKKIPIVLHESDTVTGRANKIVSLLAKKVCLGLRQSTNAKEVFTGNPIRDSVQVLSADSFAALGIKNDRLVLYISGGSQGSEAINSVIYACLPTLLETYTVLHVTGRGKQTPIQLPEHIKQYYKSWELVQTELADCYNVATIAITRASANTITELAACSVPIIAVPLRHVGHDHQQKNAEYIQQVNAGLCVQQTELANFIQVQLAQLLTDEVKMTMFQRNVHQFFKSDSANMIANQVLQKMNVQVRKK